MKHVKLPVEHLLYNHTISFVLALLPTSQEGVSRRARVIVSSGSASNAHSVTRIPYVDTSISDLVSPYYIYISGSESSNIAMLHFFALAFSARHLEAVPSVFAYAFIRPNFPISVGSRYGLEGLQHALYYIYLRQGPALKGRNSPVFAKRFWKGNK